MPADGVQAHCKGLDQGGGAQEADEQSVHEAGGVGARLVAEAVGEWREREGPAQGARPSVQEGYVGTFVYFCADTEQRGSFS